MPTLWNEITNEFSYEIGDATVKDQSLTKKYQIKTGMILFIIEKV